MLINRTRYTVERLIHGPNEPYNDIAEWNYTELLHVLGASSKSASYRVETVAELEALFNDSSFHEPDEARVCGYIPFPVVIFFKGQTIC